MVERRFRFLQKLAFLGQGHKYEALERDEVDTLVSLSHLGRWGHLTPPAAPPRPQLPGAVRSAQLGRLPCSRKKPAGSSPPNPHTTARSVEEKLRPKAVTYIP
jgi:hypothetical protein